MAVDPKDASTVATAILETVLQKLGDEDKQKEFAEKAEAVSAQNVEVAGKSGM